MCKNLNETPPVRPEIEALKPYVPGLSIAEIREKYALSQVTKMASNENPLGTSPLVQERLSRLANTIHSYPQAGNPRLVEALAKLHNVDTKCIVLGNGSDEIIDLLMRICCESKKHNIVCFKPCFGIYTTQAQICGIELRQLPLNPDFSFPFEVLFDLVDENTALVFITTPDNPSGFCPDSSQVLDFAKKLPKNCLLVIDEAYMDFTDEAKYSLLSQRHHLNNIIFLRTFSKSYGLAGLRLGYGIMPKNLAEYMWRTRLPFSVNILAEEAGLAALDDHIFYTSTLDTVRKGRKQLFEGLQTLGCKTYPSHANFIMFEPPSKYMAQDVFEKLLQKGIIIRPLKSYDLAHLLRISIGTEYENNKFLLYLSEIFS